MSSKTFVPYEGAVPSKRQARRLRRQADVRQAKRLAADNTPRAVSGLDRKAMELGIYDADYRQLPRKQRSLLVHKASSTKQAA